MAHPIDFAAILSTIDSPWKPHTLAAVNDYDVRVVKTRGRFRRVPGRPGVGLGSTEYG
jgi:hypothetical protein